MGMLNPNVALVLVLEVCHSHLISRFKQLSHEKVNGFNTPNILNSFKCRFHSKSLMWEECNLSLARTVCEVLIHRLNPMHLQSGEDFILFCFVEAGSRSGWSNIFDCHLKDGRIVIEDKMTGSMFWLILRKILKVQYVRRKLILSTVKEIA